MILSTGKYQQDNAKVYTFRDNENKQITIDIYLNIYTTKIYFSNSFKINSISNNGAIYLSKTEKTFNSSNNDKVSYETIQESTVDKYDSICKYQTISASSISTKYATNAGFLVLDDVFKNQRITAIQNALKDRLSSSNDKRKLDLNKMFLQKDGFTQIYNFSKGIIQELKNIQQPMSPEAQKRDLILPTDAKYKTSNITDVSIAEVPDYGKILVQQFNQIFAHILVDPSEWYLSAVNMHGDDTVFKDIYDVKLKKAIANTKTKSIEQITYTENDAIKIKNSSIT